MAEYIEREAAIESLPVAWDSAINALRNAPAADVAPVVRGRWIGSHGLFQGKCSVCGYMTFDKSADWARNYWPYCPKCGARMNGDNGEEG